MKKLSRQNFDELVRERLSNFEAQPPAGTLDRIKSSVKQNPGNTGSNFFSGNKWLLSSITVIAVVSSIAVYSYFNRDKANNTHQIVESGLLANNISPETSALTNDLNSYAPYEETEVIADNGTVSNYGEISAGSDINTSQPEIIKSDNESAMNVQPQKTIKANAGSNFSVCGLKGKLKACPADASSSGKWQVSGPGNVSFSSNDDPEAYVIADTYGKYTFTWTESLGDMTDRDEVFVEFLRSGDLSLSTQTIAATCHNSNGTAEVIVNGGDGSYSFFWNDETTPSGSYRTNLASGKYSVKVVDGENCQISTAFQINDSGIVQARISHVELSLSKDVPVYFTNHSKIDDISYKNFNNVICLWSFGDGSSSDEYSTDHTYLKEGTFSVKMVMTSGPGCKDSAIVNDLVITNEDIHYPNVFTPNNDGMNDLFIWKARVLDEFNGTILNRLGQVLFEWNDQQTGWDGKLKDGSYAMAGTYLYVITGIDENGKRYHYEGSVELCR
ncbi:MAG: gliding motility-associated C-terminal domain-containing protein [Bacteroidota bacterium]